MNRHARRHEAADDKRCSRRTAREQCALIEAVRRRAAEFGVTDVFNPSEADRARINQLRQVLEKFLGYSLPDWKNE